MPERAIAAREDDRPPPPFPRPTPFPMAQEESPTEVAVVDTTGTNDDSTTQSA